MHALVTLVAATRGWRHVYVDWARALGPMNGPWIAPMGTTKAAATATRRIGARKWRRDDGGVSEVVVDDERIVVGICDNMVHLDMGHLCDRMRGFDLVTL